MHTQNEIVNKQHILAEGIVGNKPIPSLSNLCISDYSDCTVLAVFSSLEKKLLAYKITLPLDNLKEKEPWLSDDFNRISSISFTREYIVTPLLFSDNIHNKQQSVNNLMIDFQTDQPGRSLHYISALISYHLIQKKPRQIYLFCHSKDYTFLLMNGETCLLANTFHCESENEVLYYLLNSLQISDILPSETTLLVDYSLINDESLLSFISPHIAKTELLRYPFEGLNDAIPQLPEKIFACYALSLCE